MAEGAATPAVVIVATKKSKLHLHPNVHDKTADSNKPQRGALLVKSIATTQKYS
jgi:hypothetical protein